MLDVIIILEDSYGDICFWILDFLDVRDEVFGGVSLCSCFYKFDFGVWGRFIMDLEGWDDGVDFFVVKDFGYWVDIIVVDREGSSREFRCIWVLCSY